LPPPKYELDPENMVSELSRMIGRVGRHACDK
jgi:hypothetical protein